MAAAAFSDGSSPEPRRWACNSLTLGQKAVPQGVSLIGCGGAGFHAAALRMSMHQKWHWSWKPRAWLNSLPQQRWRASTPNPVLAEALGRWAYDRSDIHDHLGAIFAETVRAAPRLIVELGTRGGISTLALLAAAEVADAPVLSVDIEDCSGADIPPRFRSRWEFHLGDDVAFAGEPFERYCAGKGLPPLADVIFLDT